MSPRGCRAGPAADFAFGQSIPATILWETRPKSNPLEAEMPAAPLIAKKLRAGDSAEAIGKELDRRAHVYANNVDEARSASNLNLCDDRWMRADSGVKPVPLELAIERRIEQLHTKRAVRHDAVKAMGFVISSNNQLAEDEAVSFLRDAADWMANRYGRENILAASIHLDEDTPHLQLWLCPVIHDKKTSFDRLSAKDLFTPNRVDKKAKRVISEGTLTKLQKDFYAEVSSGYGFTEPWTVEQRLDDGREYVSQKEYKARKAEERAIRAKEDAERAQRAAEAVRDAETAKLAEVSAAAEKKADDLRQLGAAWETAKDLVAELDQQVAERTAERNAIQVQIDQCKANQGEEHGKLTALQGEVAEKRSLAADLKTEILVKTAEKVRISDQIADFSQKAEDAAQRLECVQGALEEVESIEAAGLVELGRLAKGEGIGERECAAQAENRALRARLAALEEEGDGLESRVQKLEGEKRGLEDENRGLGSYLSRLRGRLGDAWRDLVGAAERVRNYLFEQVGGLKWVFDALGLESYEGMAPLADRGYDLGAAEESGQDWEPPAPSHGHHL